MGDSVEEKTPSLEEEEQPAKNDNSPGQVESPDDQTPHEIVTEKSEETPTAEKTDEIPSEEKTDEIPSEEKTDEIPSVQDSDEAPVAEVTDNAPSEQKTDESPAEENTETPEEEQSEKNAEEQEVVEEKPAIKIETAPADFRFPTTNQTRHCFTRYIEYHRCIQAKGEDAEECNKFAKYYRSLCPTEWVERWNEQRENGTFPGPL